MQSIIPNSNSARFVGMMFLISILTLLSGFRSTVKGVKEVPVMKVNFYLMGIDDVDDSITLGIGDNVRYLNEEFEGQIVFELDQLFQDRSKSYLPDIHADVLNGQMDFVEQLIHPIETNGNINIYVFPTYCPQGSDRALMGFTPIMSQFQDRYKRRSPEFDRIYISYEGLDSYSTLVHEMGHFLGLQHPWEMSAHDKVKMGLNSKNEYHNHMSYSEHVSLFTTQQLDFMRNNALKFRKYLIEKTIWISNRA